MKPTPNLGDILDRADTSAAPALIDVRDDAPARTWTLTQLNAAIDALARGLTRSGLEQGARVAILGANRAEFLQAYLAIMRAGFVAVPINHQLPRETLDYIFADAEIAAAFADDARAGLVPPALPQWRLDEASSFSGLASAGAFETPSLPANAIAQILYTSGSTGRPKGVPLTHDGQVWALTKMPPMGAPFAERLAMAAPLYHMNGLLMSKVALANKITLVLMPRFSAPLYMQTVAEHRCTIASGIPTMFVLMARERTLTASLDLSCVRMAMMGSAPLTPAIIEDVRSVFPNAMVWNGYGTTESGPFNFGAHPQGVPRPDLSVGHPYADVGVKLVGPDAPERGELYVKSRAMTPGYLNLPHETAKRIQDGWYQTGDIMRRDENGFFFFVGRADDMFVCGGENIYPGELEKLLETHPAVHQALVVGAPDTVKGQIPVAFVVKAAPVSAEEIKAFALERAPAYLHPRIVLFKEAMPLSGPGKIDRRALNAEATAATAARRPT